jgi:hypothetical protein
VLNYTNNEPHYYAALSSLLLLLLPHSKYSHCTLFSDTSLCPPPLNTTDQVSHPHKTTDKI